MTDKAEAQVMGWGFVFTSVIEAEYIVTTEATHLKEFSTILCNILDYTKHKLCSSISRCCIW